MSNLSCSQELEHILQAHDMPAYPIAVKDAGVGYTDYLTGAHRHLFNADPKTGEQYVYTPHRNRQCAIGYHTECTLGDCGCVCHEIMALFAGALRAAGE